MKKLFAVILLLLAASFVNAAEIVTATVTITNAPADLDTITINANVRTWKTTVATPATQIATVALAPGTGATNLYNQVVLYPITGLTVAQTATNVVTFRTTPTTTVSVTLSAAYGSVVYTTNTVTALVGLRVPFSSIPDPAGTNRAYQANQILLGLENHATNWLRMGANGTVALPIISFVGDTDSGIYRTAADTWHLGANGVLDFTIGSGYVQWNGSLYGTNGTLGLMILNNPTTTNLVNYGNAISSPGTGSNSEQFGKSATSTGSASTAMGYLAVATNTASTAVGNTSTATGQSSSAFGYGTYATNTSATAIGASATATGSAATAVGAAAVTAGGAGVALGSSAVASAYHATGLGAGATASHTNTTAVGQLAVAAYADSTAIGSAATTTAANQIRLGTSAEIVSIPGNLTVAGPIESAEVYALQLPRFDNTSLATGNNSAVNISTNSFMRISSGPGGAFSLNGILASGGNTDGRQVTIYNATANAMTIANDSGVDATAANRIYTLTGADVVQSGVSAATFLYDSSASRWILISKQD